MSTKTPFSPLELILLLEIHSLAKVGVESPARKEALEKLQRLNLVKQSLSELSTYNCTDKGITFIERLKATPLPIKKWTYEDE